MARKAKIVVFMLIALSATTAGATVVSFDIAVIFDGPGVPTNPAPWLNATFDDGGSAGTVDLTISALGLDGDNEKAKEIYFNLDPALLPTGLVFSAPGKTGTFDDPVISTGVNSFKAGGNGHYDILLAFDTSTSGAFNGGDVVEYTISLASLTANSFDFTSTPGGGMGVHKTAVHLQSLGTTDESAWATTPEPATIMLLSLGGLALIKKRTA